MNNSYYDTPLYVAQVDEKDVIIGPVERWEAHKKGILHRGFTAILVYKDQFLLQHRKHPAFDGFWDLTFSSHQVFEDETLESDNNAIYKALEREWNLKSCDTDGEPEKLGSVYYKAKDPNSIFTEHEIDYIYTMKLLNLPKPNMDYMYGYELIHFSVDLLKQNLAGYTLAPWVEKIIRKLLRIQ
jgi:isopentenyl-diphosphate delta-isomerase